MKTAVLKTILYALPTVLSVSAMRHKAHAETMRRHDATVQIQTEDGAVGRW